MITEGTLQDFSLPDLLQILALGGATGTLTLHHQGRQGRFYFEAGSLIGSESGDRRGREAACDLFLWQSGVFDFAPTLPEGLVNEPMPLEAICAEGHARLEKAREIEKELPDFFSARTWIYPMQLFQPEQPALVEQLGSGMSMADLARHSGLGELALRSELARLYRADQIGLSSSSEEQLRRLFSRSVDEIFGHFASISGWKMVESLERQLNEAARHSHWAICWRGGKVQDSLPDNWTKEQLLAVYQPLFLELSGFVSRVYGPQFIERVMEPLLEIAPPPQRALWKELSSQAARS